MRVRMHDPRVSRRMKFETDRGKFGDPRDFVESVRDKTLVEIDRLVRA